MFGRKHAVGNAVKGVAPRGEHRKTLVRSVDFESNVCAFRFSYPVFLCGFRSFRPVDIFKPFEKLLGVLVYIYDPLLHIFADDGKTAAFAFSVDYFVVCKNGTQLFAPVDGGFDVAGKTRFIQFFENPLRPFVVGGVACGNRLIPVIRKTEHFQLCGESLYIRLRKTFGIVARLYRILFRWQSETVETYGVQDVIALHSLHSGKYIGSGITFRVSYVQTRARGVGEHIQNIIFGLGKIVQVRAERLVVFPVFNPFFFNAFEVCVSHMS